MFIIILLLRYPSFKDHFERDELVNLARMGVAVESTYMDQSQYINNYIQNVGKYAHDLLGLDLLNNLQYFSCG
jgi:hypothetical protein